MQTVFSKINLVPLTGWTGNRKDQNKVVHSGIHKELRGEKAMWLEVEMSRREGFIKGFT